MASRETQIEDTPARPESVPTDPTKPATPQRARRRSRRKPAAAKAKAKAKTNAKADTPDIVPEVDATAAAQANPVTPDVDTTAAAEANPVTPDVDATAPAEANPATEITQEAGRIQSDAIDAALKIEEHVREHGVPQRNVAVAAIGESVHDSVTVYRDRQTSPCVRYVLKEVLD